jgi:uncharacterized protein (TIGR02145 family)
MKKSVILTFASAFLIACFLFDGCKKDNPVEQGKIGFAVSPVNSNLKSSQGLEDVVKVVLTIQHSDGSPTAYTSAEVKLYQMNGIFYTQSLVLEVGLYRLTEFYLTDSTGNTVYAAPLSGSLQAQNVNDPLPIAFEVSENETSSLTVEVLSTEELTPGDFGFIAFPVDEVPTFSFLIAILDQETGTLIKANLLVSNGTYVFNQQLDSIANNVVTIRDSFETYTLTVTQTGYAEYVHTYPIDSLKLHLNMTGILPLVVELEKELTVTDYDGNVYHTVKIGTQVWLKENMKSLHYSDGTPISGVYTYNNDENNVPTYGRLYTWDAVMNGESSSNTLPSGVKGISPVGWHVPSFSEMQVLVNYLGGSEVAGGKLKEVGTTHWISPNTGATNISGFTGLPAGRYDSNVNSFLYLGNSSQWWTCTFEGPANGGVLFCYYNTETIILQMEGWNVNCAYSVRCIKN